MFKNVLLLLLITALMVACPQSGQVTHKQSAVEQKGPKQNYLITETGDTLPTGVAIPTQGKRIDPNSVSKPKTVPLLRKAKVVPVRNNVFPLGKAKEVPVPNKLKVITPGENGVPLPKTILVKAEVVPAIHLKPVPAGPPEIP